MGKYNSPQELVQALRKQGKSESEIQKAVNGWIQSKQSNPPIQPMQQDYEIMPQQHPMMPHSPAVSHPKPQQAQRVPSIPSMPSMSKSRSKGFKRRGGFFSGIFELMRRLFILIVFNLVSFLIYVLIVSYANSEIDYWFFFSAYFFIDILIYNFYILKGEVNWRGKRK
jgi:hypothetical protein